MIKKPIRFLHLLLLGLAASWLAGLNACSNNQQYATPAPEIVGDLQLLTVQKTMAPDCTEVMGTVRAAKSAQLSSQAMGTVTRVNVHEGDLVRRGDVLITIDAAQQRSAYDSANASLSASQQAIAASDADLALAEATMKRYQLLYDKRSVSPQEYDEVKTRLAAARARRDLAAARRLQAEAGVSEAITAMGFTRIRAPFDGLVVAKLTDAGSLAAAGVPLLNIEDPTRFRLEATVDESQIGAVRLNETVSVVIDSLGSNTLRGKVVQIVPMADPASRSFTVKVDLPANPGIRSGLFGRACFVRGERESILLPRIALLHRGQLDGVYVVQERIASLRYVTLGKVSESQVEILSGLENGERIVAEPGDRELSNKQIGVK